MSIERQQSKKLDGMAIVVGQSKYNNLADLPNAARDAFGVGKLLEDLGFSVSIVIDQDFVRLKRSFDNFLFDVSRSDVSLVYYSGHAVEAGGENFLVPIDADFSSLDYVGGSLVSLSTMLNGLESLTPITIVLLDACRDNPFPEGTLIRVADPKVDCHPISPCGLYPPRRYSASAGYRNKIGTLIGFAAEPGKAALDSPSDVNSPYTGALLRHLSAIRGMEVGEVMRMVTEEVYLSTEKYQRPWINESLGKFLYFGVSNVQSDDVQSEIDKERRPLLLMIADMPRERRAVFENIADVRGIKLGTIYGILRALDESDIPRDGDALDRLLNFHAETLKRLTYDRKALESDNPEIRRLSSAAERAIHEGSFKAARTFLDRAKIVVEATRETIEGVEAKVSARRKSNAVILARSAEAAILDFDYQAASVDFRAASLWAAPASREMAIAYRIGEAESLVEWGYIGGDLSAQEEAVSAFEELIRATSASDSRTLWGQIQNGYANALSMLASIDPATAAKAVEGYENALSTLTEGSNRAARAVVVGNLAAMLTRQAVMQRSSDLLIRANDLLTITIHELDIDGSPSILLQLLNNAGNASKALWSLSREPADLLRAVEYYNNAIKISGKFSSQAEVARIQNNLGLTLQLYGDDYNDPVRLLDSMDSFCKSIAFRSKDKFPLLWALTTNNLGFSTILYGTKTSQPKKIEVGIRHATNALLLLIELNAHFYIPFAQDTLAVGYFELANNGMTVDLDRAMDFARAALNGFNRFNMTLEAMKTDETLGKLKILSKKLK